MGSLLVFWPYSFFGQNHLCVKDVVHRGSTFRVMSRSEEIQVPCQPSGRCVIPSGHPSVYCSILPNDVSSRPDARQSSIISPDDVFLPSGLQTESRSFPVPACSVRTFQQHVRMPISTRSVSDSFQVPRKGRSIYRPDDVVSRSDACLHKARIAVQI
jgi:hypothetical protein